MHSKWFISILILPGDCQSLKDNSTQVVSIVLGAPFIGDQQWFGLGFSDQGYMIGSTAMIVKPNSTSVEVVQYALKGQVPSAVVPDTTGLAIVGVPHAYYDAASSTAYMSFQVNFAKSTAKANYLLYAYGSLSADGSVQKHLSQTTTTSTFVSGLLKNPILYAVSSTLFLLCDP